jgi:hypothetical protein
MMRDLLIYWGCWAVKKMGSSGCGWYFNLVLLGGVLMRIHSSLASFLELYILIDLWVDDYSLKLWTCENMGDNWYVLRLVVSICWNNLLLIYISCDELCCEKWARKALVQISSQCKRLWPSINEKITRLSKGHSPNKFLENLNSKLENKLDCKSSKPKDLGLKRPKPNSKWTVKSLS